MSKTQINYETEYERLMEENKMINSQLISLQEGYKELEKYCKDLLEKLNDMKEENVFLMRKVIVYQEAEIQGFKSAK